MNSARLPVAVQSVSWPPPLLELAGLAARVEAVHVHDRDTIVRVFDEVAHARVAVAIPEHELVRPLHRVLGRGPLTRVVRAHLEEHGTPSRAFGFVAISMPSTVRPS